MFTYFHHLISNGCCLRLSVLDWCRKNCIHTENRHRPIHVFFVIHAHNLRFLVYLKTNYTNVTMHYHICTKYGVLCIIYIGLRCTFHVFAVRKLRCFVSRHWCTSDTENGPMSTVITNMAVQSRMLRTNSRKMLLYEKTD